MKKSYLILFSLALILFIGCSRNNYKSGKNISQATGWKINSADGGFKLNSKYKGQINAPGMIFVQGGTFVKGNTKDNVMHDWNNTPTQQYVRSFFMDETEVTNAMYGEYLFWLKKMYGEDKNLRRIFTSALPDTLVWRNPLGFNEDMVNNYLRHPAFQKLISNKNKINNFKNSDYIMKNGILVGCHQGLKNEQIKYIHNKIENFI